MFSKVEEEEEEETEEVEELPSLISVNPFSITLFTVTFFRSPTSDENHDLI
jgi:hypothetical protein